MEKLLMFLIVIASTFTLWVKDVQISIMDRGYRTVHYSLEHAVHDAALQVNKNSLADGKVIFTPLNSEAIFKETLQRNLPLDNNLLPYSNSILEGPLIIRDIAYLDDNYINPDTGLKVSFPFVWNYTMPDGEILNRAIFGPSIAVVIDVHVKGAKQYEQLISIQEYKK